MLSTLNHYRCRLGCGLRWAQGTRGPRHPQGKMQFWEDFSRPIVYTRTHPFNGHFSGTTQVSWYQKGKTNMDFTEARDSEWQWHHLGHMQVCTLLQTDNHASNPPVSFLQAGCPSCRPTNSIKALTIYILYPGPLCSIGNIWCEWQQ